MMVFVVAVVGPYLANQAGWVATETGRQPFVVYPRVIDSGDGTFRMEGGLRTVDGLSNTRVVKAGQVLGSILMFSFVYILLFAVWVYVLNSKIHHGPDEDAPKIRAEGFTTPFFDAASQLANPGGQSLTKGDSAG
jgi:cytochrome d ubiquinol oxidase subunit I